MQDGWIKLWRKIIDSDMYQQLNSHQRDVFIQCLLLANHKEKEWEWNNKIFKCKPGQLITSLAKIKEKCAKDNSIQKIRLSLNKLEKWGFLTNESTKTGRLITIRNWKLYQGELSKETKKSTKSQQRVNKEATTNKNIKNEKNVKKYKYMNSEFVKLTPDEFKKLKAKYGEHITKLCIEKLDNYIGSTGKKYKSHYRTILNWVADEVMKTNPMSMGSKGGIPKVVKEMEKEGWKHND